MCHLRNSCPFADDPPLARRADVISAFENPDEYDWAPATKLELVILEVLEEGQTDYRSPTLLYDRDQMHKIVNGLGAHLPAVMFQFLKNLTGLRITRMDK